MCRSSILWKICVRWIVLLEVMAICRLKTAVFVTFAKFSKKLFYIFFSQQKKHLKSVVCKFRFDWIALSRSIWPNYVKNDVFWYIWSIFCMFIEFFSSFHCKVIALTSCTCCANAILLESLEVGQMGLNWPKIGLFCTKCLLS